MSYHAQAFIFNPGRWYVRYPDGNISRLMPFWIAIDYKRVFGGSLQSIALDKLKSLWDTKRTK